MNALWQRPLSAPEDQSGVLPACLRPASGLGISIAVPIGWDILFVKQGDQRAAVQFHLESHTTQQQAYQGVKAVLVLGDTRSSNRLIKKRNNHPSTWSVACPADAVTAIPYPRQTSVLFAEAYPAHPVRPLHPPRLANQRLRLNLLTQPMRHRHP